MVSWVIRSSRKQWRTHPRSRLHEAFRPTRITCARFYKLTRLSWILEWRWILPRRYRALYKPKLKKFISCIYLQDLRVILFTCYNYYCRNFISQTTYLFYSSFYIRWKIVLFCAVQVNWRAWVYCLYYVSYCHYG